MAIATITKAYIRRYRDNGQTSAYVEWLDAKGQWGRTSGEPDNAHMQALFARAAREGISIGHEEWES